ncbi:hypothetical protein M409DRAFT_17085 [Zasmidium cellare ATCC 36951]|uniref:Glutathione synthetase n=1 Tax=Zasmidium cellare ATCC 36951 TaxID=1080233 RepID=A0A6A6D3V5_ZASCE|nr:uncharacterized protein M409DRAFT_17085 [Zasmidium cellare ATCC 36951]KAF2173138.1 hypothetical protein M409DRAFT_17085 [Zasmidium cellare ATCC 36951]
MADLKDDQVDRLVSEIHDYQITHGSLLKLVRLQEHGNPSVPCRPVSVSLLPTAFPGRLFDDALALQQSFNELYVRASNDHQWLESVLRPLLQYDEFVRVLWKIVQDTRKRGQAQPIVCGIFRSDYMVQKDSMSLKQVEMNTFSVAGACHAERAAKMHRHVQNALGIKHNGTLLESNNTSSLVESLALAHEHYEQATSHKVCVLMIVQGMNFNIADERPIEYGLVHKGIPCYRCDWYDVLSSTTLDRDGTLLFSHSFDGEHFEVSVVYYRAGYEYAEYEEDGIRIRLHLEQSRAIKCPDVLTHLMTLKIMQAALAKQGVVERYLPLDDASGVRGTFMPMQPLDGSEASQRLRQEAMAPTDGARYVVKPNLEGGGHNIFDEAVPQFLELLDREVSGGYTIMRMIEPPQDIQGLLNTGDRIYRGPVVSELGVLGTCLWRRGKEGVEILSNKAAGWTFKTKPTGVQEMNVVKGNGCFDCPLLT